MEQVSSELNRRMNETQVSEKARKQELTEPPRGAGRLPDSIKHPAKRPGDSDAVRLRAASEAARLLRQLVEQAAAVEILQTPQRRSEEQAAGLAQALSIAEAALKTRTAECAQAQEERRRLEAQLSELRSAAEEATGARQGLEQTAAQTTEELRSLRPKLDAEVRARRLAQEKIAQLQQEMAGYRQLFENPAALRDAEVQLAKRVGELVVAQEQVRTLTEELRIAHEANAQQNERVDKLRRLADELKRKCDALAGSAKAGSQEQDQLQIRLDEETARRQAAEAEIERLRREPPWAKPEETEPEAMDADSLAELRNEVQAALKAAAPNRLIMKTPAQPVGMQKAKAARKAFLRGPDPAKGR